MKKTCDYCGNYLSETDENCPCCGAPNPNLKRTGEGVPATIEELKAFCERHHLPLEDMRFFIGEDCREARAFGIYQDEEGLFVVYKNKADGTRAVRYRGKDEAYAVNELYQKLQSEILSQRQHQAAARDRQRSAPPPQETYFTRKKEEAQKRKTWRIFGIALLIFIVGGILWSGGLPDKGYYTYNGGYYYSDMDHWYSYDEADGAWYLTDVDDELDDHYRDYFDGEDYDGYYGYSDWADSEYASDYDSGWDSSYGDDDSDWDSDWDDDDWDWDSGSDWDSGYTDWDSDW